MLKISTISVFPGIFEALSYGMPSRAMALGVVMKHLNIADYSSRKDKRVDDRPFGGGPGMVIQADVLQRALASLATPIPHVIIPDPKGPLFSQQDAKRLSLYPHLCFICGRYEGLDQRFLDAIPHERFSVCDAVASGGELPSALMIDAITREVDSVLGNHDSLEQE